MREQILKISDVYIDDEIYPRENYSTHTVNLYKKDMKFGAVFPNIWVAKFKGKYYLVDGLHRLKAKEELGEEFVKADVQANLTNKLDIYLASIRVNVKHGKSLSTKDKIKVAKQLKKMRVDFDDISKLLHIETKDLEKVGLGNISDIHKMKITHKGFTSILKDTKKKSYPTSSGNESDSPVPIMSREEEQYGELDAFLWYLKNTEFISKKPIRQKLVDIQREVRKAIGAMKR